MFKTLTAKVIAAWHDEMRMLQLAIFVLMPVAMLVLLNFGMFFIVISRHPTSLMTWSAIGLLCMSRAAVLRFKKLI